MYELLLNVVVVVVDVCECDCRPCYASSSMIHPFMDDAPLGPHIPRLLSRVWYENATVYCYARSPAVYYEILESSIIPTDKCVVCACAWLVRRRAAKNRLGAGLEQRIFSSSSSLVWFLRRQGLWRGLAVINHLSEISLCIGPTDKHSIRFLIGGTSTNVRGI